MHVERSDMSCAIFEKYTSQEGLFSFFINKYSDFGIKRKKGYVSAKKILCPTMPDTDKGKKYYKKETVTDRYRRRYTDFLKLSKWRYQLLDHHI